jgi:hypothetical protein
MSEVQPTYSRKPIPLSREECRAKADEYVDLASTYVASDRGHGYAALALDKTRHLTEVDRRQHDRGV